MTPTTTNRTIAISISCTLVDGKVVFVLVNKDNVDVNIAVKKSEDYGASYSGFAISLVLAAGSSTTVTDDNIRSGLNYLYTTEATVTASSSATFAASVNEFTISTITEPTDVVGDDVEQKLPETKLLDITSIACNYVEKENKVVIRWLPLAGIEERYKVVCYVVKEDGSREEDMQVVVQASRYVDTNPPHGQAVQYTVFAVDADDRPLSEPCETQVLAIPHP